jgi:hypothetical protein
MNILGMWDAFTALNRGDRLIAIAISIIGFLLIIRLARLMTKRSRRGVLIRLFNRVFATSSKQVIKDSINTNNSCHEGEEIHEPLTQGIVGGQQLSKSRDEIPTHSVYHSTTNDCDNQKWVRF